MLSSLITSTLYHLTPGVKYFAIISARSSSGISAPATIYSKPFSFTLSDTRLDHLADDSGVLLYPNPATNYLMINSLKKVDKVEITDLIGKTSMISYNETKINISQLQKGIYLIRIYQGDKVITKKIMKI